MSQSDLGRRLGVSFQQIQKYEKGVNRVGAGRLPQIAKIFRIPVGALFDANADTSAGESTGTAPVKLIPDRNTLKLLTAFGDITNHGRPPHPRQPGRQDRKSKEGVQIGTEGAAR